MQTELNPPTPQPEPSPLAVSPRAVLLSIALVAMIADVVEEDRRSQAMSLFNVTYLVGVALGPFIGGAANDLTKFFTESVPRAIVRHGPKFVSVRIHERIVDPYQSSFYVISFLF